MAAFVGSLCCQVGEERNLQVGAGILIIISPFFRSRGNFPIFPQDSLVRLKNSQSISIKAKVKNKCLAIIKYSLTSICNVFPPHLQKFCIIGQIDCCPRRRQWWSILSFSFRPCGLAASLRWSRRPSCLGATSSRSPQGLLLSWKHPQLLLNADKFPPERNKAGRGLDTEAASLIPPTMQHCTNTTSPHTHRQEAHTKPTQALPGNPVIWSIGEKKVWNNYKKLRMRSSRKNLFIVRSAPVVTDSRKRGGSIVWTLFKVKINEVLHCGTGLGVFSIVQNHANGRDSRLEKQIFYPTKGGCQRLTSIPFTYRSILTIQAIQPFKQKGALSHSFQCLICM